MKIYVTRSSGCGSGGDVREYSSLEQCVNMLLSTEDYDGWPPRIIISQPDEDEPQDCEYVAEIYDDWRE